MKLLTKTLLASAIASVSMTSAYAAEPINFYGKLNVTAQSNDIAGESETTIQSNASRFGLKGTFEINSSIEAFYTIEYQVDTGNSSSSNFTARNQFVGLKGDFGAISVGRNDTMLKKSQGRVDLFNDLDGDLKNVFAGENRLAQTATYVTPSFNNFQAGVTYAATDDNKQEGEDGFSLAAMYGDSRLNNTPVYAAIAYDSKVAGYDIVRATVQGKIAGLVIGGMYQQEEELDSGVEDSGYLLSASYKIDNVTLKAQYQENESHGDSWSVGGDYKLAKPTKLFAFYTHNTPESGDDNDKYFGIGLEHSF